MTVHDIRPGMILGTVGMHTPRFNDPERTNRDLCVRVNELTVGDPSAGIKHDWRLDILPGDARQYKPIWNLNRHLFPRSEHKFTFIEPPTPPPRPKASPAMAGFNKVPTNLDERLANSDLLESLKATIEGAELPVPSVLDAVEAIDKGVREQGAADLEAHMTAGGLVEPQSVTHNGKQYAIDQTATPTILVVVTPFPASEVPVKPAAPVEPPVVEPTADPNATI